jgi:hypothetical protein
MQMSNEENTEIERLGERVAAAFECAWPVHGMVFADIISRTARMMAVTARCEIPELRDLSAPIMGDDRKRQVLARYLDAIANKFAAYCDPSTNPVSAYLSKTERVQLESIFTPDVAQSFRIHITAATELIRNGMPFDMIAQVAQHISGGRMIDAALSDPHTPSGASRHQSAVLRR